MTEELKTQTLMLTREVVVECPNCDKLQEGFIGNPAGGVFTCEDCDKDFKIHPEADIDFR